ncbi:unnamed protein product [Phytophthora fragariaefolia]|uniref:Unnamed protein product n=1 Tax=Phytophthora fragariaefolia TaxID=1490495 RepID=A0A9W6YDD1_9STRA|nr:unnamed protein product [Phytophthora fragariaefolia]
MFSSWDLVRPRFWYPMSSLEQSMMELDQMNDLMMRPRFPFGMQREVSMVPAYLEEESESSENGDGDDFFVDLPVVARKCVPTAFQVEDVPEAAQDESDEVSMDINGQKPAANEPDTDASTDMDVDAEGASKSGQATSSSNPSKLEANVNKTNDKGTTTTKAKRHNKNKKHNKQLRKHAYKVTPSAEREVRSTTERDATSKPDADCPTFSSYSFSNSSVIDGKGNRVTTTRRRYEDSTGRLKAVHEREIGGKKLRTTWSRQSKEDEGQHESICSSGSPEEFEALWQQTPFGEAQKKKVKGQLQSSTSGMEKEVEATAAALKDANMDDTAEEETSTKKSGEPSVAKGTAKCRQKRLTTQAIPQSKSKKPELVNTGEYVS